MNIPMYSFLMQTQVVDLVGCSKDELVSRLTEIKSLPNYSWAYSNRVHYLNIPAAFDIETSSFKEGIAKKAIMYVWQCNINGTTFMGRTWVQFTYLLDLISEVFELRAHNKRLLMYVHNLEYEWQFMRKWIHWEDVFADGKRSPLYAVTTTGIEFRCSYKLSGYSLAKVGDELQKYHTEKAVGDLDYRLIRTSSTPLTEQEIHYCVQDTKVVICYIQEEIERNQNNIAKIPYTKTGYVRRYCREKTVRTSSTHGDEVSRLKGLKYRDIMRSLKLDLPQYQMCKRAFQGGFTHANINHVNETLHDVGSIDFTSSYPYTMVSDYFPMSSPVKVTVSDYSDLLFNCQHFCCMFDVKFNNIRPKIAYENPISSSRCRNLKGEMINNGRVIRAESLETTITELDFDVINKFYKYDSLQVGAFYRFYRGYLPTDFVDAILGLYEDKTTLKGVPGKEVEYLVKKGMLNSAYGMAVTDIVRDAIEYHNDSEATDGWYDAATTPVSQLTHYNNNIARFLYYPWGVWVTAHARHNLFTGIYAFGNDYVYSDTDSIKALNMEAHKDYIDRYNAHVREQLEKAAKFHGFPMSRFEPKTIKGVPKLIGVWDYEGTYDLFKTLGAKRYLVSKNNDITFTVAGCKKQALKDYMLSTYKTIPAIFDAFTRDLEIPPEKTGKLTHAYIDREWAGQVVDYLGNVGSYYEKSSIHLEPARFKISMLDQFWDYVEGVRQIEH